MPDKIHKTKGIVLRTVKYGETSIVVSIFTELFGVQSYLVNGVRTASKKGAGKANLFQSSALLELVVYHNELKQLNRIKEFKWAHIYQTVLLDVQKNAVALFMIELLFKCLKQPEANPALFHFTEDCFLELDLCEGTIMANLPLFFALHLSHFFGFRLIDDYSNQSTYLDLQEGSFTKEEPSHPHFIAGEQAFITSQLLKTQHPDELKCIKLHHEFRRRLLHAYENYYALHIPDFGKMKTLAVLKEIIS